MSDLPFSYTAGVFIDESILMTINEYNYNGAASPEGGDSYAPYQVNCPIPGAWARENHVDQLLLGSITIS